MAKTVRATSSKRACKKKVIGSRKAKSTSSEEDDNDDDANMDAARAWEYVDDTVEWWKGPAGGDVGYTGPYGVTWHLGIGWWWRWHSMDWRWK